MQARTGAAFRHFAGPVATHIAIFVRLGGAVKRAAVTVESAGVSAVMGSLWR